MRKMSIADAPMLDTPVDTGGMVEAKNVDDINVERGRRHGKQPPRQKEKLRRMRHDLT